MNVTLRFTTKWPWNVTSPIIAWFSGSRRWSHCMIIIDDMAYEATMLHGCRAVPVGVAMEGMSAYQDMMIPFVNLDAMKLFGEEQAGKPYDFCGAFGIPFFRSSEWSDDRKWWCSELSFAQLIAGGVTMLDPSQLHRVTPNDLFQCNYIKYPVVKLK